MYRVSRALIKFVKLLIKLIELCSIYSSKLDCLLTVKMVDLSMISDSA